MILGQILILLECLELLLELRHFILDCYNSNYLEYRGWYGVEATDWTTKESWFSYQQGQEGLLQSIQSTSGAFHSMGTGKLSVGVDWLGLKANHSHFVPRLRLYGAIPPLPHIPSWRA